MEKLIRHLPDGDGARDLCRVGHGRQSAIGKDPGAVQTVFSVPYGEWPRHARSYTAALLVLHRGKRDRFGAVFCLRLGPGFAGNPERCDARSPIGSTNRGAAPEPFIGPRLT